MENRIREIFWNYGSFSDEEEKKAYQEIIDFAENNFDDFKTFLQRQKREDYRILIDALSQDTKKWSNLFFNEIKRIFKKAENSSNPAETILFLDEFVFIEIDDFLYSQKVVDFIKPYLKHKLPVIRFWASIMLTDFMDEDNLLLIGLIEELLKDEDWRIRYKAYNDLIELRGKNRYKLSFSDKIKSKMFDPYKFD